MDRPLYYLVLITGQKETRFLLIDVLIKGESEPEFDETEDENGHQRLLASTEVEVPVPFYVV
jgi:hypothetical protein